MESPIPVTSSDRSTPITYLFIIYKEKHTYTSSVCIGTSGIKSVVTLYVFTLSDFSLMGVFLSNLITAASSIIDDIAPTIVIPVRTLTGNESSSYSENSKQMEELKTASAEHDSKIKYPFMVVINMWQKYIHYSSSSIGCTMSM